MRGLRNKLMAQGIALVALLLAMPGAVAAQSPQAEPITAITLAQGLNEEPFSISDRRPRDFTFRQITIPPGATTGWHYHDGELVAVVHQGTLTRITTDCRRHTHPTGSALVEPAGRRQVHAGYNLGIENVVLFVTYLIPQGQPLSVAAEAPRRCHDLPPTQAQTGAGMHH